MASDAAAGDLASAYESFASFMTVQASAHDDQSSDLFEPEIEEYVSEARAAGRLYLIV